MTKISCQQRPTGLGQAMKIAALALIATVAAAATFGSAATAHADQTPAAHGVEAPIGAIPWPQVGPGWLLAMWSPVTGGHPGEQPAPGEPTYATAPTRRDL